MPARSHVLVISIAALAMVLLVSTCGGDPDAFEGTVVAPLETLSALTPGPEVYATLTAKAPAAQSVAGSRPDTPTPRPSTPTSRPDTPAPRPDTPTPQPDTPTPRPPTATPQPATSTPPPPTPESAEAGIGADVYLDVLQQVGSLGNTWTLSDIRVGIHPDKVRIVWEMSEVRDEAPYTEIVEVDNSKSPFPRRGVVIDPSWGAARIDIMISDCYAYDFPLNEELPVMMPPEGTVATKMGLHPTFDDAVLGFSVGLKEPAPYEVFTLTDPVRIVVDVLTEP